MFGVRRGYLGLLVVGGQDVPAAEVEGDMAQWCFRLVGWTRGCGFGFTSRTSRFCWMRDPGKMPLTVDALGSSTGITMRLGLRKNCVSTDAREALFGNSQANARMTVVPVMWTWWRLLALHLRALLMRMVSGWSVNFLFHLISFVSLC